ncbi:MAG: hypothetical protein Greene07147_127 [Parcubacteria group bacterium Greene0714_7]|nr:MAG: hypothetical protein Greene07147_127 [Parcubacteria group bacterium Greene0714_7]
MGYTFESSSRPVYETIPQPQGTYLDLHGERSMVKIDMERGEHSKTNPLLAGVAFLGALLSPFGAGAQSQDPYYNDPNRPLSENIRRFNEAQARRRASEAMSSECQEIIAITRRQIQRGEYPEYLEEDVSSCSPQAYQELSALNNANERRRQAEADRRSRGGNP